MSGDVCTCGATFRMGEDFKDHMPCPGTETEQELNKLRIKSWDPEVLKPIWTKWHKEGVIESDQHLREMIFQLKNVIKNLKSVNEELYALAISALFMEWNVLSSLAYSRNMKDALDLIRAP